MQMKWLSDVEDYRKGEQRERERASRGVIGCDCACDSLGIGRRSSLGELVKGLGSSSKGEREKRRERGERERERNREKGLSSSTIRVVVEEGRDGVRTPLIGSAPAASMSRILILSLLLVSTEHLHYASKVGVIKRGAAAAESPERRQLPLREETNERNWRGGGEEGKQRWWNDLVLSFLIGPSPSSKRLDQCWWWFFSPREREREEREK